MLFNNHKEGYPFMIQEKRSTLLDVGNYFSSSFYFLRFVTEKAGIDSTSDLNLSSSFLRLENSCSPFLPWFSQLVRCFIPNPFGVLSLHLGFKQSNAETTYFRFFQFSIFS